MSEIPDVNTKVNLSVPKLEREYKSADSNRMILKLLVGTYNIISRTNGLARTLKWLKNNGECSLDIICLDREHKPLEYTRQRLEKDQIIESYNSDGNTYKICCICSGTDGKIEIDR